jgi:hypothetical protein
VVDASIQLWSVNRGPADAVVGEDPDGTSTLKRVELQLRVLVDRRNSRVSNYSHTDYSCLKIPLKPLF